MVGEWGPTKIHKIFERAGIPMGPGGIYRPLFYDRIQTELDATEEQLQGGIDAVVNNAGWSPLKPAWELEQAEIEAILAVNATGPILISAAAVRLFRKQNAGRLVQVSSIASDDPFPGLGVYGAAKAALNTLTTGLSNELGEDSSIRVFCVAPGAVETDLLRSLITADDLPTESCLTPDSVAAVIADCASGARDAESGKTIWMPSP